jgi:putative acetyltransferase
MRLRRRTSTVNADAVLIRREIPSDQRAILDVHSAAFATSDGSIAVEALLVDQLRQDGDAIDPLSLVAEADGHVVGHVTCSRANVDGRPSLGLGPLGVLPGFQHRGVGSALMHAVLAAADALDSPAVFLLGDPAYYRRFGFELAHPLGVLPPDPHWTQHFQVRTLSNWTADVRGTFHYAPAFSAI